jgi:hypothetical protein
MGFTKIRYGSGETAEAALSAMYADAAVKAAVCAADAITAASIGVATSCPFISPKQNNHVPLRGVLFIP